MATENKLNIQVITSFNSYTFNFSCFVLRNVEVTFQRLMDLVMRDLPCVMVYVNVVLFYNSSLKQHLKDVEAVLQWLRDHSLYANPMKWKWWKSLVTFLGYSLDAEWIFPLPQMVITVENFPSSASVKSMQEFIRIITYYHQFLPHNSDIMRPIYSALEGKLKKLQWLQSPASLQKHERTLVVVAHFPSQQTLT